MFPNLPPPYVLYYPTSIRYLPSHMWYPKVLYVPLLCSSLSPTICSPLHFPCALFFLFDMYSFSFTYPFHVSSITTLSMSSTPPPFPMSSLNISCHLFGDPYRTDQTTRAQRRWRLTHLGGNYNITITSTTIIITDNSVTSRGCYAVPWKLPQAILRQQMEFTRQGDH